MFDSFACSSCCTELVHQYEQSRTAERDEAGPQAEVGPSDDDLRREDLRSSTVRRLDRRLTTAKWRPRQRERSTLIALTQRPRGGGPRASIFLEILTTEQKSQRRESDKGLIIV